MIIEYSKFHTSAGVMKQRTFNLMEEGVIGLNIINVLSIKFHPM
jgi:hypothetical protein